MSLPDHLLDPPDTIEYDGYCDRHDQPYYEKQGCVECYAELIDEVADEAIEDRKLTRGV